MSPLGRLCAAAGLFVCSGCLGRGDVDLLEANLRQSQDAAARYQRQLVELHGELDAARAEVEQLRTQLAKAGSAVPQEQSQPLAKVAGIQFHSMMTGGRDQDGQPGHDVLTAVLTPIDHSGELVKLAGEIQLELLDLTRTGDQQRIGNWSFSADQSHKLWHSGFIASGYQFDLPLSELPKNGQAVLHGRMVTSDGRQFDTTCPIVLSVGDATTSPGNLVPSENARPLTASPRRPRTSVQPTSKARTVEPAGYASLDNLDEIPPIRVEAVPASRPVPDPVDITPDAQADAFELQPVDEADAAPPGRAKPFPSGVQTSVNWTDATMPLLR